MKLKNLMKKVESANEIAKMTGCLRKFRVYVEMDRLMQKNIKTGFDHFENWKDLISSIKDDWNESVVWAVENIDLCELGDGSFEMEGDAYVKVTVLYAIY